jgi:hypothetical protein
VRVEAGEEAKLLAVERVQPVGPWE